MCGGEFISIYEEETYALGVKRDRKHFHDDMMTQRGRHLWRPENKPWESLIFDKLLSVTDSQRHWNC